MDNQIKELSNRRRWKGLLKRTLALLCAVVMLFTMNTLKRNADTLERIPMCGLPAHVHTPDCYGDGGELICGLAEHIHTDACYQQRPSEEAVEAFEEEGTEALDMDLPDDGEPSPAEEPEPEAIEAEKPLAFGLGSEAMVSQIIEAMALEIELEDILEVGAVEDDEAHIGLIGVEALEDDFRVWAKQDFIDAELALVTENDILIVLLADGVAAPEEDAEDAEAEPPVESEESTQAEPAAEEPVPAAIESGETLPAEVDEPAAVEETVEFELPETVEEKAEVEPPVEVEEKVETEQPAEVEEKNEVEQPVDEIIPAGAEQIVEAEEKAEAESPEETDESTKDAITKEDTESPKIEEPTEGANIEADAEPAEVEEPSDSEESAEIEDADAETDAEPAEADEIEEAPDSEEPTEDTEAEEAVEDGDAAEAAEAVAESADYAATIDLSEVEEYPLSLNALLAQALPELAIEAREEAPAEAEAAEEAEDAPAEEIEEAVSEEIEEEATAEAEAPVAARTVEYDRELLALAEAEDDWLVTPIASFEETRIVVTDASRYELTLVNCALEPVEPEAEPLPAQDFEGSTEFVKVSVSAPEGAFPEGTTMTVVDVEDEQTLTDIEQTVSEDFVEVKRVHAVDITFFNAAGEEIEPLAPIAVVISVAEIEQQQDAVVVHVDDAGAAEVVESQSEAPAGETELTLEMPATEQAPAEEAEAEPTDEEPGQAVAFEADSFSVYAVVVTETIETRYIDDSGDTWRISVGYGPEANIPSGATLKVEEVPAEDYLSQAEATLAGGKRVTLARFFDIKIMDGEDEVQPEQPVTVNVTLLGDAPQDDAPADAHRIDAGDPAVCAMHFEGEQPRVVAAAETDEAVVFDAEGFSVWGVVYTVDFYYGNYEYHLNGGGSMTLSALFDALKIEADAAQAADVVFTNPELVAVVKIDEDITLSEAKAGLRASEEEVEPEEVEVELGEEQDELQPEASEAEDTLLHGPDWLLVSLAPFDTHETLTVTMEDGTVYEIRVEDEQQYYYWAVVNDKTRGYFTASNSILDHYSSGSGYVWVDVEEEYEGNVVQFVSKKEKSGTLYANCKENSNSKFCLWLKIKDDEYTQINDSSIANIQGNTGDTTYIAYFAPDDAKLIVVLPPDSHGSISGAHKVAGDNSLPQYCYTTENTTLYANPGAWPYFFDGWYVNGERISTRNAFDVSTVTEDTILTANYIPVYRYYFKANEDGKAEFCIPGWGTNGNDWINWTNGMSGTDGEAQLGYWKNFGRNLPSEVVANEGVTSFEFPVTTRAKSGSNYVFAYWLRDDGATPITSGQELCGFKETNGQVRDHYNELTRNTTYIAFYKPQNDYIVRVNFAKEGGSTSEAHNFLRSVRDDRSGQDIFWYYYAYQDNATIIATPTYDKDDPNNRWTFDGWYHNGTELISTSQELDLKAYYEQLRAEGKERRDLNLTPVFKRVDNYFHVWYDGTNGVGGGGNPANVTFYTRITSKNQIIGSTSVHEAVAKDDPSSATPSATITLPTTAQAPQSASVNGFGLQGWYCVIPGACESIDGVTEMMDGGCYKPGTKVKITGDAVFYADWFPASYDIGQNTSLAPDIIDTSSFITTRMYDYNNLFNMNSIYLNQGESVIPAVDAAGDWTKYNQEYWYMNGNDSDFIFMSTVSGQGRSLNPFGRDFKNQNREISTNGGYYTATRTTGLLTGNLKDRLFSTSNGLGKRYLGKGDFLYRYDADTGYYYYDSDKNAASYNQSDGRFYVYDYTNMTNKSGADKTDFLPLNYGAGTFTEAYGEPNYWFGMTSEIKFYLPNDVNGNDNAASPVNISDKNKEMVYKFAGDDDVWVFVDGQLVLDMGGVHGKVYGEINFSRGTTTICENGTEKTLDSNGYMTYGSGGTITPGTIDLTAGDHTLTLYYLERGASQSNCAIYFNLTPKYGLKIEKKDHDSAAKLRGAVFGVFTNSDCADEHKLCEMTTDAKGIATCTGLVANETYYIKELVAPAGYPDMSAETITLTIAQQPSQQATVSASCSVTSGLLVGDATIRPANTGEYLIKLNLENKKVEYKLRKREAHTEGKENTGALIDAEFKIYKMSEYDANPTGASALNRGFFEGYITGEKYFKKANGTSAEPTDDVLISQKDGNFYVGNLPNGEYVLVEVKAPEGYINTQGVRRIKVLSGKLYNWNGSSWSTTSYNYFIDNSPIGSLKITKAVTVNGAAPAATDTHTNGTYQFNIDGVAGTDTASIHRTVKITFTNGKATKYQIDSEAEVNVTTATTNEWSVVVPNLAPGQYTVSEAATNNGTTLVSATGGSGTTVSNNVVTVTVVGTDTAAAQTSAQASFTNGYFQVNIGIVKIDEATRDDVTPTTLSGAKFKLERWNGSQYLIYPSSADEDGAEVSPQGQLIFSNIPEGYYKIEETKIPAGYIKTDDNDIYFTVANGVVTRTQSDRSTEIAPVNGENLNKVADITYVKGTDSATFTVGNTPGARLPSTGGSGTVPVYILGGALIALALVGLLIRRKARNGIV